MPSNKKSSGENNFVGAVLTLKSLVSYQKNSVISKQIMSKKTGSLTLFAFDQGEGLSEHTSPYEATLLVLDGKAVITIAGKNHAAKAGELIILPANVPHAVKAPVPFKMLLIMIRS